MKEENNNKNNIGRRNFLKALATVPFLGAFTLSYVEKNRQDNLIKEKILKEFKLNNGNGDEQQNAISSKGQLVRVGIIGFGFRGEQLARAAGYAHPDWIEEKGKAYEKNRKDTSLREFYGQDNLNMDITGICDVFDIRTERGITAAGNKNVKRYKHYQDMLESKEIDAVIIATPDHWHAQMGIDAAAAGKHVYIEKCMTQNVEETFRLRDAVRNSNIAFQLGHTGRQNITYQKAKKVIKDGILGPVSIIEMPTNRNNPFAAWVWPIHKDASEKNIDWEQFLGPAPYHPFSLERFFQWRRWWDYGTGMSGDLLTHEFDAVNMIMELGIPASASASGGIYYWKDGRNVPDVFNVTFEYPDRNLTVLYTGTLFNGDPRKKKFMGHDATMEVAGTLTVSVDAQSTKYKDMLEKEIIDPNLPLINYKPGQKNVDAVTTATEKYFADRGLAYTFRSGRRVNTTTLHIAEWLNAIRNGGNLSCNINQGFEEAITAHMATLSFKEGRKVIWDRKTETLL